MRLFSITRPQFLDRVFDASELAAMAEMLRQWYRLIAGVRPAEVGYCRCEAILYAFPRPDAGEITASLSHKLPGITIDSGAGADPDELHVAAAFRPVTEFADIALWREVLTEPRLRDACVRLRFTVHGHVGPPTSKPESASTFVFCGTPAENGSMLVKAIWHLGFDDVFERVYRAVEWQLQAVFLAAFEVHLFAERVTRDSAAAAQSLTRMGKNAQGLFATRGHQRLAMWLIRHRAELPDDRGPRAFAWRVGRCLLGAAAAIAVIVLRRRWDIFDILCAAVAGYLLFSALRIASRKAAVAGKYYAAMRAGLGRLHANPIDVQPTDLSADRDPTLLKYSRELLDLGAHHLMDVSIATAANIKSGNRVYALGDATASLGLLRASQNLRMFPSQPVILLTTRFKDGTRHVTVNKPIYRKQALSQFTTRCAIDVGLPEMAAMHRRITDRFIAAGRAPEPPTRETVITNLLADQELSRERWQHSPYGWSDAIHEVFKVPRRAFLRDPI